MLWDFDEPRRIQGHVSRVNRIIIIIIMFEGVDVLLGRTMTNVCWWWNNQLMGFRGWLIDWLIEFIRKGFSIWLNDVYKYKGGFLIYFGGFMGRGGRRDTFSKSLCVCAFLEESRRKECNCLFMVKEKKR